MTLKSKNKVETNHYELEIVIDSEAFAEAISKAYTKNVKKITIPGFRKGKAPRHIIERLYGENFFYEDALELLYPEAVESAIKEAGLELVSNNIKFDLVSMDKNGVDFKVTVVVKPEVELGEYKGLKAEKLIATVTDEEIDQQVKTVAERNARLESITDRAAAKDDTVVIDYEGSVDGVAFEGGKADSYSLKLGSNTFIPGFEDQIIGHNIDDEFDVNVKFPDDYHAEELKGKEAVFKVKLHEIKVTELPEINDDFAKDVSEFDTLEEYKADIKKKAIDLKEKKSNDDVDNTLIEALIDGLKVEIPQEMIDSQVEQDVQDFAYRLQMQGLDLQTYVKYMGGDMNAFKDSFKEQAEKQVKVRLALEKIAEVEDIKPTAEEIDEEYKKYADGYQVEIEKVKAAIPETEVVKDLGVKKAIDFVRDNAVITEVDKLTEKKPAAKKTTADAKKPAAKKTTASKKTATKKTEDK